MGWLEATTYVSSLESVIRICVNLSEGCKRERDSRRQKCPMKSPDALGRINTQTTQTERVRSAIVLVGVTPHQGGRKSLPQGEGPELVGVSEQIT